MKGGKEGRNEGKNGCCKGEDEVSDERREGRKEEVSDEGREGRKEEGKNGCSKGEEEEVGDEGREEKVRRKTRKQDDVEGKGNI